MAGRSARSDRAGRIFYGAAMGIALGIGALQMFHIRGGFITNYGADLFGTAWLYGMFRQGRSVFQRGRPAPAGVTAMFVLLGCVGSEIAQKTRLFPGVFDAADVLAYGVSVLSCYGLDRRFGLHAAKPGSTTGSLP